MKDVRNAVAKSARGAGKALRAGLAGIRLLIDPSRLDEVFALHRGLTGRAGLDDILDRIRRDPAGAGALDERIRYRPDALEALRAMPEGSLGRAYADFMTSRGLSPEAIPKLPADDDAGFVQAHLYETHDLWHVLTGFDTDIPGELGVQAFYAAQIRGLLPSLLISGALLQALVKGRHEFHRRLEAVARGYALGQASRPLFGIAWASEIARPLADVRARFLEGHAITA